MRHYFALVQHDDDSAYGIQFPDIAGVYSASDDVDNIVSNAVDALRLYAEDMELPAPSSHAEIMARESIREELANGAFLISVPLIDNDTGVVRANVTFERGLLRAIDETARARGLTRAAFLASAARQAIEA
ncbi:MULTISPECIES: type II toxin-antitoxin system HicB family antitoxin [unclassified Phyllobacterium]|uniref:type II toxin-antitoxin system HicB family antitoxin n=1 Tax=unclassified Phyllobacterium TaxID=2638441 RepID=UPI0004854AB0|nr:MULTISPECIES: type II toxin-antitoxin system HicB family antitoxin [unclassified Phyllobacterium]SFI50371.1 Predicted nuclease of the RNAse H fold, HicB family [Phyllobacterium sp. CL33Tsu]